MASRVSFKPGAVRGFATLEARKDVRKTCIDIARISRNVAAPGGPYSTGKLKRSIKWEVQTAGWFVRGRVGSELPYAIYVHEGVDPHVIRGTGGRNLSFFWRKRGVRFRGPKVNHPGQEAQPFLVNPMLLVAARRGYAVKVYR